MLFLGLVLGLLGLVVWQAYLFAGRTSSPVPALPEARFVGAQTCAGCHVQQYQAWRSSQHAQAMQHATSDTVLGNFDGVRFEQDGKPTVFLKREGKYFVRTAGADGNTAEFRISHTFGVYPLQQYLVPFPDGRLQALPFAWDSRPKGEGGQRWFFLYPGEKILPGDPLHWTRLNQNWNWMCADCHSTRLERNYDAEKDRYQTTFAEMNVACEACHGPASNHVAWAKQPSSPASDNAAHFGLTVPLTERKNAAWVTVPATGNAIRSEPRKGHVELAVCAQCHSRRAPLVHGMDHRRDLLDSHDLALLEDGLYFADGQQREEVYNVGSFLQSKMHASGVSCGDCHEPHSGKLRLPGDQVCSQCHAPAKFAKPEHTLHPQGSRGAACVDCHMPTRDYMVIDSRHDHSFRIPRPDIAAIIGAPDACTDCHKDRSQKWAAGVIEKAYGRQRKGFQTFGPALHAARNGSPEAGEDLAALIKDPAVPAIARATALRELRHYLNPTFLPAVEHGLADADPLVRAAAVDAIQAAPLAERLRLLLPLAQDPANPVRIRIGFALAPVDPGKQDAATATRLSALFEAYISAQSSNLDRPESRYNLGLFYAERGDPKSAEAQYRAALILQPDFAPAYANLAELYRQAGNTDQVEATLQTGLSAIPGNAELLHALGLQRVRQHRMPEAVELLGKAVLAAPSNSRYAFVHAVALHDNGLRTEAMAALKKANKRFPGNAEISNALALYSRE